MDIIDVQCHLRHSGFYQDVCIRLYTIHETVCPRNIPPSREVCKAKQILYRDQNGVRCLGWSNWVLHVVDRISEESGHLFRRANCCSYYLRGIWTALMTAEYNLVISAWTSAVWVATGKISLLWLLIQNDIDFHVIWNSPKRVSQITEDFLCCYVRPQIFVVKKED